MAIRSARTAARGNRTRPQVPEMNDQSETGSPVYLSRTVYNRGRYSPCEDTDARFSLGRELSQNPGNWNTPGTNHFLPGLFRLFSAKIPWCVAPGRGQIHGKLLE